jgi:hypothetical protein
MSLNRRLWAAGLAGAQQRLVALSLQVNLARAKLQDDPATAAMLLDSAREELRQALDELGGLADRVAALDGRLRIQSPDGVGTAVRAELPCASS